MFNPQKILVATAFTAESDKALREARILAEKFGSTVHLINVIEDIQQCGGDYCLSEGEILAEKNKLREEAVNKMNEEIRRIMTGSPVTLVTEIRFGNALDEILTYERDKNIDLVITAPHRKHKRRGLLNHHLAEQLTKKSVCEAMVVR